MTSPHLPGLVDCGLTLSLGDSCFCGNTFSSQANPSTDQSGGSDVVCAGDPSQYCGGLDALQVYATKLNTPSPSIVESTQGYTNQGLYDDGDLGSRLLAEDSTSDPAMSVEYCATFCSTRYSYFGVENGK